MTWISLGATYGARASGPRRTLERLKGQDSRAQTRSPREVRIRFRPAQSGSSGDPSQSRRRFVKSLPLMM